ncbi:MAG: tetratricopeptide repeat protein [Polyangiaceae bacterium]
MGSPRAVVIPFGVPEEGRGLGVGLAALLHGSVQVEGQALALAQLHARPKEGDGPVDPTPVEAYFTPESWRELAGHGNAPTDLAFVLTGAFEPPEFGKGHIELVAFEAGSGHTRARFDGTLDGPTAGATLTAVLEGLFSKLGVSLGPIEAIRDLDWDALESVLRAERNALVDPARGVSHDRMAALMFLGRAVGDAPTCPFPAGRLANLAVETVLATAPDARAVDATTRTLERALADAPAQIDLVEALATVLARQGRLDESESRARELIRRSPDRVRGYALVAGACRARGERADALHVLDAGLARLPDEPTLLTERGVLAEELGDPSAAKAYFRRALAAHPTFPPAFLELARCATASVDVDTAAKLVDDVLGSPDGRGVHPAVLHRAIHLAMALEPEGLPRSSRVAAIARKILAVAEDDPWGHFFLARALSEMGERAEAKEHLLAVERIIPRTPLGAEAMRGRFSLEEPEAAYELETTLKATESVPKDDLVSLVARARRIALAHDVWFAYFVLGVAERRRGQFAAAKAALGAALVIAPGASPVLAEHVTVSVELAEFDDAVRHARELATLEGERGHELGLYSFALASAGRTDEARSVLERAKERGANAEDVARVLRVLDAPPGPVVRPGRPSVLRWLRRIVPGRG